MILQLIRYYYCIIYYYQMYSFLFIFRYYAFYDLVSDKKRRDAGNRWIVSARAICKICDKLIKYSSLSRHHLKQHMVRIHQKDQAEFQRTYSMTPKR